MRLLDLFCGAGGAAMGYHRAGFTVTGVDIKPQPRYPFTFIQGDALEYVAAHGHEYDAIHASPPCQAFTRCRKILEGKGIANVRGVDLVAPTREALTGHTYVIENVPGAPLINPVVLCGTMFGLGVYRHRLFEFSDAPLLMFPHPRHNGSTGSHRGYSAGYEYVTVGGHNYNRNQGASAMGIEWMSRDELNESIPPAYTEWIGRQLKEALCVA